MLFYYYINSSGHDLTENKKTERFLKDPRLPQAEVRYSVRSERVFKPHIHSTLSIGAVDDGEVAYRVKEEEATLQPGSLALINPEVLHSCNAGDSLGRSYYMLYLDVDYCLKIQQSLWHVDALCSMESILLKDQTLYERYIRTMGQLMDTSCHLLEKEQLLADLVSKVFVQSCGERTSAPNSEEKFDSLKKYLSSNLEEDLTLEVFANTLGANPYTLLRQFKNQYGITPHAYRMNYRIEMARKMLQEGKDIADTALACGFFDQSHFHKHFKAMTTVTPREYQLNFIQ